MPVNKSARFRYEIIDECLRNTKKKWSKSELLKFVNRRLELHYGEGTNISISQLRYDLMNMQSECAAPIEMYREGRGYFYRYEDADFSIRTIPIEEDDITKLNDAVQLLQQIKGFTIADDMTDIVRRLEGRDSTGHPIESTSIAFETAPDMPGIENLEDIYHAIQRKNVLKISYQAFKANTPRTWHIHPYLLKEYDHRWYLLGYCQEKKNIGVYALDRMGDIRVAKVPYIANSFINGDDYFRDVIGVTISPQKSVEEVVLLFSSAMAPYIRTKPLHRSQKIASEYEDGRLLVKIGVIINPELVNMLMGYGKEVKVLGPAHLVENIHQIADALLKQYE